MHCMDRRKLEDLRIVRVIIEERIVDVLILRDQLCCPRRFPHLRFLVAQRWQLYARNEVRVRDLLVRGVEGQVDPMWHRVVVGHVHMCVLVMELQERYGVQGLLPHADQIAAHAVVYDALLRYVCQLSVDLEHADAGGHHHAQLARPVETTVQVVFFEDWNQV